MRSWLFAELMGHTKGIDYDGEVVAIGTILHDIGLTAGVSGPNRFEVNGADAALSFITGRGLSDRLVMERPETSYDNFLRDFGERFVPGYKPVSIVDMLINAPFDE